MARKYIKGKVSTRRQLSAASHSSTLDVKNAKSSVTEKSLGNGYTQFVKK